MRVTTAPTSSTNVNRPKKAGASRTGLPTPDSQPNASQMTNAVLTGMITAASMLAPNRPMPNIDGRQVAGDGPQCHRGIGSVVDDGSRAEQRRGRREHDAERDGVGPHRADHRVGSLVGQVLHADALLGDGGLEIELHVGRDGGADHGHRQQQHLGGAHPRHAQRWVGQPMDHAAPVGMDKHRCRDVRHEHQAQQQEQLLQPPIAGIHDHQPEARSEYRHRDHGGDAEQAQRRGCARELGDRVGQVGEQQHGHGQQRPAHAKAVTDEVREALARDGPQPCRHLLDDAQDHGGDGEQPQQGVAGGRAHDRVGRDATGIVARHTRDEARAEDGQEWRQPTQPDRRPGPGNVRRPDAGEGTQPDARHDTGAHHVHRAAWR